MNEDVTESIFYCLIEIGLSEEAAYYCLRIYGNELKKIVRETEENIRQLGNELIKQRIYRYVATHNANQEDR